MLLHIGEFGQIGTFAVLALGLRCGKEEAEEGPALKALWFVSIFSLSCGLTLFVISAGSN